MAAKYPKWPLNIPAFSILRASKIYPNWDFWYDDKPSGNPGVEWTAGRLFQRSTRKILQKFSFTIGEKKVFITLISSESKYCLAASDPNYFGLSGA
jgi:hypothetical protein